MNESVQRDAERVTAEEIRLMAEQLESGLAGVYSMLSQELQLPLIKRVLFLMEQAGEIPPILLTGEPTDHDRLGGYWPRQ